MMRPVLAALVLTAAPASALTTFDDEGTYLAALAVLTGVTVVTESFENDAVWGPSRNSIVAPGSTASITSKGLIWTSNQPAGEIATGDGAAIFGNYGFYALPHGDFTDGPISVCDNLPDDPPPGSPCWQNDGWRTSAAAGTTLFAYGGWVTTNTGGGAKVTLLVDGVDVNAELPDNPDNVNRDGWLIPYGTQSNRQFVGVIDEGGFSSVEMRELAGKDSQLEYIFGDRFTVAFSGNGPLPSVPLPASGILLFGGIGLLVVRRVRVGGRAARP